jgi:hypothetical protein
VRDEQPESETKTETKKIVKNDGRMITVKLKIDFGGLDQISRNA